MTATSAIEAIREEQLEAFDDNYIVRPHKDDDRRTASGLIVVSTEKGKKDGVTGEVIYVGPGELMRNSAGDVVLDGRGEPRRLPMNAKVGDIVTFAQWSGTEYELQAGSGRKVLFISQKSVIGRVNVDR